MQKVGRIRAFNFYAIHLNLIQKTYWEKAEHCLTRLLTNTRDNKKVN
jgi:hypothetical protein